MKTALSSMGLVLVPLLLATGADSQKLRYSGTVVDPGGKPLAGATVELYNSATGSPGANGEAKPEHTVTTQADGAFAFDGPGSATIFARKPGLAPAWTTCWNQQTAITDERLMLTPPASISGSVVDDADKPVADALVWISTAYYEIALDNGATKLGHLGTMPHRDLFSARTGPDGKFRIDGCPTNAAVDLGVTIAGKVLREPERQYISPETMRCRPGQKEVKLVVDPAGIVEGKVRSRETGQPIAGAQITLARQGRASFSNARPKPIESGTDGKFRIGEVGPGSYRVHAYFGTNTIPEQVAESVAVNVEAGRTTPDIDISATTGGFLQVAVLAKGTRQPVPQVSINAFSEAYQAGQASGTNGLVLLRLPPGAYQVTGYRENARSEQVPADVEMGTTNQVEIEISPPARIAGSVRDPSGAPVPDLELKILPNYRANVGPIKTDAQGRFDFPWNPQQVGGPNNTCCIVARDLKRNLAVAQDLEEGTTNLQLKLEPGLSIAGRVEDLQGKPLTNATINVYIWAGNSGDSFDNKPIKADAEGRFEISALPPDRRYSASATAKGYGSSSSQIQTAEGENNRLELATFALKVADRKLAGQVVDAEDKPVARAWVHMYGNGQPNHSLRTDEQGRFHFDEVCEGRVQLSASTPGGFGNIGAEAGDTNVVLKLGVNQSYALQEAPSRASLKGKPLPSLAALGLTGDCAPAGKPVLLCLFDIEQRPCRRFVRLLAEQHDTLREKGLAILGLQAAVTTAETLQQWKDANPLPFQVGLLAEKNDQNKWASEVQSFPWLILADKEHLVLAEGFSFDELEARLKDLGK